MKLVTPPAAPAAGGVVCTGTMAVSAETFAW
jgi:hypothetical protein